MHDYQLRSFLAAARLGSFSKAAKEEHVAVQAFALRIRTLEQELSLQLFIRTAKGVELTKAGEEYVATAEGVLAMLDSGRTRAKNAMDQERMRITVGFSWRISQLEQNIFLDFQKSHPDVVFEYVSLLVDELVESLLQGRIDAAMLPIVADDSIEGLRSFPVASEPLLLAVRPQSPFASGGPVDPRSLEGTTVQFGFDYRKAPGLRFMETYFPEGCVLTQSFPGDTVVMRCLESDRFAALFNTSSMHLACPPLVCVPLLDSPRVSFSIACRTETDPVIAEFSQYYSERYRALSASSTSAAR
ncbi:LysR family transcriptional regulator [Eggerthella guodeyinii]|uniref:LysR family transcriptional regulator n=1 Tax=Eggerthella guodeyinii TaxID=2690837 RepID=A0A6N7RK75_9ACTN|nr:LysR family transcriptional regulator [Eggerthella guodeyinii]MRX81361.1 LysR family transcriptional regulator [Eggerthella guodeyinii]